tara:strand:- start:1061 stop:1465 length:405 start_codon:yes stop_codon:yes gene_type:complete
MNVESKYNSFKEDGVRYMQCKHCYDYRAVSEDTVAITCSKCTTVIQLNKFPDTLPKSHKKKSTGRPAGWHFMNEFVDKDGNVFHKGVEQPDLKGTLKPTKVKPPKKRKKKSKTDRLLELAKKHKRKLKIKRNYK